TWSYPSRTIVSCRLTRSGASAAKPSRTNHRRHSCQSARTPQTFNVATRMEPSLSAVHPIASPGRGRPVNGFACWDSARQAGRGSSQFGDDLRGVEVEERVLLGADLLHV